MASNIKNKSKGNKRTVDNWKKKKWFEIYASPTFDSKLIGESVAIESKKLIDRKIKKSLNELTNNIRDSSYEIIFKINKVTATKADTVIDKFSAKTNFLRRIVRRQKSKIEPVFYVETKDGQKLKIKVLFITGKKYTTTTRTEARKSIVDFITSEVSSKTIQEAWNDLIFQHTAERLKKKLIKLGYVNKVLISKVTVVK